MAWTRLAEMADDLGHALDSAGTTWLLDQDVRGRHDAQRTRSRRPASRALLHRFFEDDAAD